jgi:cell division protein ZapA (FtsZ GTPase activity inhibitor)
MLEQNDERVEKSSENTEETVSGTSKIEEIVSETAEENEVPDQSETILVDETTKAVQEIEKSVAEEAEKELEKKEEVAVVDFSIMSLDDLVSELSKVISSNPVQKIKSQVEAVKSEFNQKFGALLAEKKASFLAEGGNSIDFQFSSPIKSEYNKLLSDYKKERDAYYGDIEKQQKENLEKRLVVIENLKDLIQNADSSTMYKNFKVIQDNWRAIGPVSKTRYNDTWKTYHHHVERFYDLLHLSNDFRDLDFKHNLEEKIKIIEKAEALVELKDVNESFKELQDLHKVWKEDIGPVSKEMREDIWQKFSAATKKIHDKRHDHFRQMRSQYQVIIDEKLSIIEAINVYDTSKNSSHNDWQKSIKDVESLRQQYFNAGKLPYSKSEEVWQKFKTVTKKFNSAKNVFYKDEKSDQQNNLKKKIALIEFAETLKDSEDWESATNALKKVQSDWKKIGHVPRKFSDDIWKRFKSACNHYFDRYHQQKNSISQVQQQVVDTKKEFLESLKSIESSSKEIVLEAISKWRGLGNLPRNARHIDGKFNKQIDKMLEGLSLDKKEISMLKFTNVVDGYALDNDVRKLDSEQMFVRKKIDETVREMQQLENNLGFFSNAKDDNPLVMNVKARVNEFKEDLVIWKSKLAYIKNLDY